MSTTTILPQDGDIADQISHNRGWFMLLAALLIIAGVLAIMFPLAGSLTVEVWAAAAFLIAGVSQTIHAFATRDWAGFFFSLLIGLLYLATSAILWFNPLQGIVTLTVFLAAIFVIDGIFRAVLAFQIRSHHGWYWILVSGLLGIVLGALIFAQLPSSAAWVLGLMLGINLIGAGASFLALTFAAGGQSSRKL